MADKNFGQFTEETTRADNQIIYVGKPDGGGGFLDRFMTFANALLGYFNKSTDDSDDVTEGSTNLYFTDTRVYTKVKALLAAGTNVTITANDGLETLTINAATGGVSDGDKGDITVSGSGTVWTIDNDAVTFDKIQNVATNRVLARSTSGTGSVEALTLPDFRNLINVEDGADVTDTANVTAAGALMDSEVVNLNDVKNFDPADYATAAQGTKADTALQPANDLSDVNDADVSRGNLSAAAKAQVEAVSVLVKTVEDGTEKIIVNSPYSFTISEVTTICTTGTCTLEVQIDGAALGGSTNAVSTSEVTESHASANTVAVGQDVILEVTAASSCENMTVMLSGNRTLD